MPNQRNPRKRMLAAWVDLEELKEFREAARASGLSLTDWVINALEHEVSSRAKPKGKASSNGDPPKKRTRKD